MFLTWNRAWEALMGLTRSRAFKRIKLFHRVGSNHPRPIGTDLPKDEGLAQVN